MFIISKLIVFANSRQFFACLRMGKGGARSLMASHITKNIVGDAAYGVPSGLISETKYAYINLNWDRTDRMFIISKLIVFENSRQIIKNMVKS
jgi:hypothetical protein